VRNIYRILGFAAVALTVTLNPAFAALSAPGPVAGIGLPALALIGGAYWVARKLLARKK